MNRRRLNRRRRRKRTKGEEMEGRGDGGQDYEIGLEEGED